MPAPKELEFAEIAIGDLPLYSYDGDADYPPLHAPSRRPSPMSMRSCL